MTGLKREDLVLGAGAHVRVIGKGRKERCTPIARSTLAVLKAWLREPQRGSDQVLFPSAIGKRLGHESPTTTHQYTQANLAMKERTLAKLKDPATQAGRFRAADSLLDFLKKLGL